MWEKISLFVGKILLKREMYFYAQNQQHLKLYKQYLSWMNFGFHQERKQKAD